MSITLRGIDFGSAFVASGAQNFFGNGWPQHIPLSLIPGFDFSKSTFVSKTTTLQPRPGNMPLRKSLMPEDFLPPCIWFNIQKGIALNSVGLSGPGARALLERNRWQKRTQPFLLSFMAVDDTLKKRFDETKGFVKLMKRWRGLFRSQFGVEFNISCPNTQHCTLDLEAEALGHLAILAELDVPIVLKINALMNDNILAEISRQKACDAITVSNTIPWGQLPDLIDWVGLFDLSPDFIGREIPLEESPLWKRNPKFGGGGLSGWPLISMVYQKICEVRQAGITLPIIAGGGIGCRREWRRDMWLFREARADAVSFGSVGFLRPWRVQPIIRKANKLFS